MKNFSNGGRVLAAAMALLLFRGSLVFAEEKTNGDEDTAIVKRIQELRARVEGKTQTTEQTAKELLELYKEEAKKIYGRDGKVSETVQVAIEKARPIIEAYAAEFQKMYLDDNASAEKTLTETKAAFREAAQFAMKKAQPVVDAYVRELKTMYSGDDSTIAKLGREALKKSSEVTDAYSAEFSKMYIGRDSTVANGARSGAKKAKKAADNFTQEYVDAFKKLYVGPDSRLSEVTNAAIEKAQPVIDAYYKELKNYYGGKDSKAGKLLQEAVKKAKPVIDAYINEFSTMYIGDDSTVAKLARDAIAKAKPVVDGYSAEWKKMYWGKNSTAAKLAKKTYQDSADSAKKIYEGSSAEAYGQEFKKMYVGRDSTAAQAIKEGYKKAKPLAQAYGHEFSKMYLDSDATALKAARAAWKTIESPHSYENWPTYVDWLGLDDTAQDSQKQTMSALIETALHNEEKPLQIGSGSKNFKIPLQFVQELIANGADPGQIDPRRLIISQEPDGFSLAVYGLTPAAAATLTCNSNILEEFIKSGVDVSENPVVLSSIYDKKAERTLSAGIAELIQFRIFILEHYMKNIPEKVQVAGHYGGVLEIPNARRVAAESMLKRCKATKEIIDRAAGYGQNPYAIDSKEH